MEAMEAAHPYLHTIHSAGQPIVDDLKAQRDAIAARIIDGADNPGAMRAWMDNYRDMMSREASRKNTLRKIDGQRGTLQKLPINKSHFYQRQTRNLCDRVSSLYNLVYRQALDEMEIKETIRARIIAGQYGDAYRIIIEPPYCSKGKDKPTTYIDAPPSEALRDAIIAYDELHGTQLARLYDDAEAADYLVFWHGKGTERARPTTPGELDDLIEKWDARNNRF